MMRIYLWLTSRVRSFLGLDWIIEAREIAENARRNNVIEEEFRRKEDRRES